MHETFRPVGFNRMPGSMGGYMVWVSDESPDGKTVNRGVLRLSDNELRRLTRQLVDAGFDKSADEDPG